MIKHSAKSHEVHYHGAEGGEMGGGAQGGCKGTRAHNHPQGGAGGPMGLNKEDHSDHYLLDGSLALGLESKEKKHLPTITKM